MEVFCITYCTLKEIALLRPVLIPLSTTHMIVSTFAAIHRYFDAVCRALDLSRTFLLHDTRLRSISDV